MNEHEPEYVAVSVKVDDGRVCLELSDGSTHSFPVAYYPRLAGASLEALSEVSLRVGGRALRWESLDEDIWIADAILQRYPRQPVSHVAEDPPPEDDSSP